MRRHPNSANRTPKDVSAASARIFYVWWIVSGIKDGLKIPKRKFNGDEIGFYMLKLAKQVIAKKGSRDVMMVESSNFKKKITEFCFSADGYCFPPDISLQFQRL